MSKVTFPETSCDWMKFDNKLEMRQRIWLTFYRLPNGTEEWTGNVYTEFEYAELEQKFDPKVRIYIRCAHLHDKELATERWVK